MKLKHKFIALSTLILFQTAGIGSAAEADDEVAIIATGKTSNGVEIFEPMPDPEPVNTDKTTDNKKSRTDRKRLDDSNKKPDNKIDDKNPVINNPPPPKDNPKPPPPPPVVTRVEIIENTVKPAEQPAAPIKLPDKVETQPAVGIPNPIVEYANFNEVIQAVNFIPLYVPKKSGYKITSMSVIDKTIAEIRYSRNWEPNVVLHIRTYRRATGEDLKDISGIHGVKWRINVFDGTTVYIAQIDETRNVAAWAYGNYTFSAYVENLPLVTFNSLVADELVDLSTHYYL